MPDQVDGVQVCGSVERQPSGRHLIKHDAQREKVSSVVEWRADSLFGAHIGDCAHHDARRCCRLARDVVCCAYYRWLVDLRQAKVQYLGLAARRDHHVGGLDVAVDDAAFVRGVQGVGDLAPELRNVVERDRRPLDPIRQRASFDVLHRNVADAAGFADVVDGGDVGMGEPGGRARLAHEAAPAIVVQRERGRENLQRDPPVEPCVRGEEHLAHAAGPDGRHDFVHPEPGAAGEGHRNHGGIIGAGSRQQDGIVLCNPDRLRTTMPRVRPTLRDCSLSIICPASLGTSWTRTQSISLPGSIHTHSPSRVIMAEKEQAWETRVARKTRKKQATAGDETETTGAKEAGQGPAKDSVAGSWQGNHPAGIAPHHRRSVSISLLPC